MFNLFNSPWPLPQNLRHSRCLLNEQKQCVCVCVCVCVHLLNEQKQCVCVCVWRTVAGRDWERVKPSSEP